MEISTIIIWVALIFSVLYIAGIYNQLVKLKNRADNSFSQIEVQLKRRYDLIPNLVDTAKGYLKHERETLEAVIAARNNAAGELQQASQSPGSTSRMSTLSQSEKSLGQALSKMNIVVEAYPDLKANENMIRLSEELSSTENKVAFSRQAFNDSITAYNTYKQSFPPVVFSRSFGHANDMSLLDFDDSAAIQAAPKVSF